MAVTHEQKLDPERGVYYAMRDRQTTLGIR